MKQCLIYTAFIGASVLQSCGAASLTIVPIGPFGQPLRNCVVEAFLATTTLGGGRQEFTHKFHGLNGEGIPQGEYEASVRCDDSVLHERTVLHSTDQLVLVVRRERIMISDPVKPKLVITLQHMANSAETWRIEFFGLYNGIRYISRFDPNSSKASVIEPETGSYFVSVESSKGYSCGRQIDLMEFTRQWGFDPSTCSFHLDKYAHLVGKTEAKGTDRWYQEMRLQVRQLLQTLRDATTRQ